MKIFSTVWNDLNQFPAAGGGDGKIIKFPNDVAAGPFSTLLLSHDINIAICPIFFSTTSNVWYVF